MSTLWNMAKVEAPAAERRKAAKYREQARIAQQAAKAAEAKAYADALEVLPDDLKAEAIVLGSDLYAASQEVAKAKARYDALKARSADIARAYAPKTATAAAVESVGGLVGFLAELKVRALRADAKRNA